MLQTILHDLLTNGDSIAQVSEARRIYFARQRALADALTEFGLEVVQADGINTWLPVQNERDAMVRLAASGIRVAGGSPFLAVEGGPAFIRVTAGALPDDVRSVAEALAAASHPRDSAVHRLGARWA
jgi:DNA-binding transcriptional MocR family regulator